MEIRPAVEDDLPAINDIYNALIPTTTIAWTEQLVPMEERRAWWAERQERGDGVFVADDGGEVVGFVAYGPFRDERRWEGYRFTVEHTIHVRESHWGRGVGRLLVEAEVEHARRAGKHVIVAGVDAASVHSVRFHEACGFVEVARLSEVGWKLGRWLDLVLLQRTVTNGTKAAAP